MPPGDRTGRATLAGPGPWGTGHGSGWGAATTRRHAWTRDRRAMLVAEFLASDEASYVTATAFVVDGGITSNYF